MAKKLQSTSLIRGKTSLRYLHLLRVFHFNPLPSSEGRPGRKLVESLHRQTSIHFPHPREDSIIAIDRKNIFTSIHFPHPREDQSRRTDGNYRSTSIHFPHPREDSRFQHSCLFIGYFNPLPSSEGRQQNFLILFSNPNIFLVHLYNFIFYLSNSQKKSRNSAIKP